MKKCVNRALAHYTSNNFVFLFLQPSKIQVRFIFELTLYFVFIALNRYHAINVKNVLHKKLCIKENFFIITINFFSTPQENHDHISNRVQYNYLLPIHSMIAKTEFYAPSFYFLQALEHF